MNEQERKFIELLREEYSIVVILRPNNTYRIYVVEDFKPYNPSNHQFLHEIQGKDVTTIIKDFGVVASTNMAIIKSIDTKISELKSEKTSYSHQYLFEWFRRV